MFPTCFSVPVLWERNTYRLPGTGIAFRYHEHHFPASVRLGQSRCTDSILHSVPNIWIFILAHGPEAKMNEWLCSPANLGCRYYRFVRLVYKCNVCLIKMQTRYCTVYIKMHFCLFIRRNLNCKLAMFVYARTVDWLRLASGNNWSKCSAVPDLHDNVPQVVEQAGVVCLSICGNLICYAHSSE